MKKPIDLYIENLKRIVGVKSDTELAKTLHLSKQAISAWRRRDSVPLAQQQVLTLQYGPEAAFDESIGYAATERERIAIISAFLRLFDKYRGIHDPEELDTAYEDWAEMLLSFEGMMQKFVREGGWISINNENKVGIFTPNQIARVLTAYVGEEKQDKLNLFHDLLRPDEL
ncbi:helix-turn-helix domain containing protein [Brucella sp. 21LCYQ03]|nr:helix-turn-helix domain containing protein [Brucella sp. 21LCYQ03]